MVAGRQCRSRCQRDRQRAGEAEQQADNEQRKPPSRRPSSIAGTTSMASPMTPPSPVGSGQEPCAAGETQTGGQHGRQRSRQQAAAIRRRTADAAAGASPRPRPAAPARSRQAEQLHRQVGRRSRRHAEQIAHRRLGGVAERGILHRPGRQRHRAEQRQRSARARQARAAAAARSRGNARRGRRGCRSCGRSARIECTC